MPTIIDLRPEIEKVSGRIAIVALLILCLCIKVYTTQFWHDMNVDHRVKCKVIDRIVEDETITQDGNSTTKKVNKLVLQAEGFNNTFKLAVDTPTWTSKSLGQNILKSIMMQCLHTRSVGIIQLICHVKTFLR